MQGARRSTSVPVLGEGRNVSLEELRNPFPHQKEASHAQTAVVQHGVALEGGKYSEITGGSVCKKPKSALVEFVDGTVLAFYGSIIREVEAEGNSTKNVFYVGKGDKIFFLRDGTEAQGLVLGFERLKGRAYKLVILENGQEDPSHIHLAEFLRMDPAEPHLDEERAKQALEKYTTSKNVIAEGHCKESAAVFVGFLSPLCSFLSIFTADAADFAPKEPEVVPVKGLDDDMDGEYWQQTTTTRKRIPKPKPKVKVANKRHRTRKGSKTWAKKSRSTLPEPPGAVSSAAASALSPDVSNVLQQSLARLATPAGPSQQGNRVAQTPMGGQPIVFNFYFGTPPP
jgi:hypothetical protein